MAEPKLLYEKELRIIAREELASLLQQSSGDPPMDTHFEKYLDTRFSHIEGDVKDIRSDIKEIRSDINALKYWIVGTAFALATFIFAVVGYYTMSMQSQFQVFSEYVKAVTQPQHQNPPSK